jgi:hypothetical protein
VQYNFEWDSEKAQSNFAKHGVTFEEAAEVFLDILHLSVFLMNIVKMKNVGVHWEKTAKVIWLL